MSEYAHPSGFARAPLPVDTLGEKERERDHRNRSPLCHSHAGFCAAAAAADNRAARGREEEDEGSSLAGDVGLADHHFLCQEDLGSLKHMPDFNTICGEGVGEGRGARSSSFLL